MSNANSNNYIIVTANCTFAVTIEFTVVLHESEFTKSVIFFIFLLYFIILLDHIAPVNNDVVTVLYVVWALHRRIIV